ncbi:MAG: hypothetical protein ACTSW2_10155 [Alphaproteobacteria bacterium]
MIRRLFSVVLAMTFLGACTSLDSALNSLDLGALSPGMTGDSLPDALTDSAVEAELPDEEAEMPVTATAAAEPPVPRRKPADATIVARREFHPDLLVGLDFNATKALLGDPALQLEEPPAKIWAYNGGSCMLNVFFYPSVGDSVFRVLTYEVRDGDIEQGVTATDLSTVTKISDKDSPVVRRCFADLLQSRDVPDAG